MLLDLVYLLALAALSPWLAWRAFATGRYRRGLAAKFLGHVEISTPRTPEPREALLTGSGRKGQPREALLTGSGRKRRPREAPLTGSGRKRRPVAWFHAVSVGEVNLLGTLVPEFRDRHPDWLVVVSSTTDTGLAEARVRFVELDVIAWPFDFTWAVAAALDAVKPSLVVLTESELWPNFLAAADARGVPVVVVNARMSPRSFRRLNRVAGIARRMLFRHVTRFAVQEADYTDRLRQLGVPAAKLVTTGSIKYDGAVGERDTPKTRALRASLGLARPTPPRPLSLKGRGENALPHAENRPGARDVSHHDSLSKEGSLPATDGPLVLLAGSTHAPEESILLGAFARLRARFPHLRLVLVPRHPDRFAEVARLLDATALPFVRRSQITSPLPQMPGVVLLDTVGELGAAWGLADVGFTGGSLDGKRGGQSMIEPAGYGVPCVFGPHVWNFRDAARRLVEVGGAVMVKDATELEAELADLIGDADRRARVGGAARELVRRQQGATVRTLDVIDSVITSPALPRAA